MEMWRSWVIVKNVGGGCQGWSELVLIMTVWSIVSTIVITDCRIHDDKDM